MQVKHLVLFTFSFLIHLCAHSQVTFTYDPVSCGVPTTNVTAAVACANSPEDAGIMSDDVYSGLIPLGFAFSFYEHTYTRLAIGANGNLTFTDSLAGTYNPWSIVTSLAGSTIRNSICGPWCDMDFPENGGSCTYQRLGTAPNRRFIVTYCRVSMYNIPFCAGEWITSQIVLYESSNIVEVHIAHKTVCNAWNDGRAICGVINASGSSSTVAPARDWATNWSANNEAWRFTPAGTTAYTVSAIPFAATLCGSVMYWYDGSSGSYLGTGTHMNIATNVPRHLKVGVFSNCRDTSFSYFTVPVPTVLPNPKEILGPDTFCVGSTVTYTDSTHGGAWSWSGNLSGALSPPSAVNITGIASGPGTMVYTLPTGCKATKDILVNPSPGPIMPSPIVICEGNTDTCTNSEPGGTWTSGNAAIVTIGALSGIITGVSAGTTLITYTIEGCSTTAPITVNPQPAAIAPGNAAVCQGMTVMFSNAVPGGSWSSSNAGVATIGTVSGIAAGVSSGTTVISYILPEGCFSTANLTVNATPGSITPSPASVCMGSMLVLSAADLGGSWSSGNTAIAAVGSGSGIVNPVSPGATHISYTFPNGCYRTAPLTVGPSPTAIVPASAQVCLGNTITFSGIPAGGTWSSDNTTAAPIDAATGVVSGAAPGTATISYSFAAGCYKTASITVSALPADITPSPAIACMGSALVLSNAMPGGTWSSANPGIATIGIGSGIVNTVSEGSTTITYSFTNGCYKTAPLTVAPAPMDVAPATIHICVGNSATLSSGPTGGTWSSGNAAIAVVDATGTVTGASPGITTVSYTLADGCYKTATVTVSTLPAGITPSPATVCMGGTLVLSNATPGGAWSSTSPGVATIGPGSGIVSAVSEGTTLISYSFANGCYRTATLTVEPTPTAIVPTVAQVCPGDAVTLSSTPSGGTWSSDNAGIAGIDAATGIVTGVSPGIATVSYALSAGCYKTATVTVNAVPADITPSPAVVCIGATLVMANATPGGTWGSAAPAVATIGAGSGIVTTASVGSATISYILPGGCFKTAVLTVAPLPPPITPAGIALCVGNTGLLGNTAGTGTWSSADTSIAKVGESSGIVKGITTGTVQVSYTLPSGCYRTTMVTVNSAPAAIAPAHAMTCVGDTVYLTNATPGGTWSSANTSVATVASGSGILTAVAPGTAIITYALPGICYRTDTVTVRELPTPIDPASMIICEGGVDTFASLPAGGLWTSANTAIATINAGGIATGVSPGTTMITYTLPTGCYRTAPVQVGIASAIVPGDGIVCLGWPAIFTNTSSGGAWSISNPAIASISTGVHTVTVTGLTAGTATITYSLPGGCYRLANITVNPSPANIVGPTGVCIGSTNQLANTAAGGTWSSNGPAYATVSATGLVAGISGGTATISYTMANGCFATVLVTVFALPDAGVITGTDTLCIANANIVLTNIPGTPGFWHSGSTATLTIDSATGSVHGWAAGSAVVTYTTRPDVNGCADFTTHTLHVLADAPFTIDETITPTRCYGNNDGYILVKILNGTGIYTYLWQDSSDAQLLAALIPGSYSITVTDTKTGCTKSETYLLSQPDSLDVTAEVSPDICGKGVGAIKVMVTGGTTPYRYTWPDGLSGADVSGLHAGKYEVTVTDTNGCRKSYTAPVRDSSGLIHVHNALSPNGDGFNDTWLIDLIEDNPYNHVQVLNKWGDVMWEKQGYNNEWTGTGRSGENLPDGTYYYIVTLNNTNPGCAEALYKGALLIKR